MAKKLYSVLDLIESLNRFVPTNRQTKRAFAVARLLDDWLSQHCLSTDPFVAVTVTCDSIDISIGDFSVWNSETDGDGLCAILPCQLKYKDHLKSMAELLERTE